MYFRNSDNFLAKAVILRLLSFREHHSEVGVILLWTLEVWKHSFLGRNLLIFSDSFFIVLNSCHISKWVGLQMIYENGFYFYHGSQWWDESHVHERSVEDFSVWLGASLAYEAQMVALDSIWPLIVTVLRTWFRFFIRGVSLYGFVFVSTRYFEMQRWLLTFERNFAANRDLVDQFELNRGAVI